MTIWFTADTHFNHRHHIEGDTTMNDTQRPEFPSDMGHWERIAEGASDRRLDRELNLHALRQDICRALLDLNEAMRGGEGQ